MKKNIYITGLLSALLMNFSLAQKGKINYAQKQYNNLKYVKSTDALLKLIEDGNESVELIENLANAYYFNSKMEEAAKWYRVLDSIGNNGDPENYFRYALALKALEKYEDSDQIMLDFIRLNPDDTRGKTFLSTRNYLEVIDKLSDDFQLENLSFNTTYSDFGASFYKSGIYFASSREEGNMYSWNEQPYLDIYSNTGTSNVFRIKGDVNTKYHESSTSFTEDGKTMYFTRNNYFNGKFKKNSKDIHSLKVYKATLIDGYWTHVEPLPFNNDEYNVAHPALSADGSKLYFASDMPGTLGNSDIFVVDIKEDGTYGEPKNLGPQINTEGRENFPFISGAGTLYFSSDGHLGLGGLDIFKFENIETIGNISDGVYNVGKPINSPKDDFGYIINEETLIGYLSSNRHGGKGDDDIYRFTRNVCKQFISGIVVDEETKEPLSFATIIIYDDAQNVAEKLVSNANGEFKSELSCDGMVYKTVAQKDEYEPDQEDFIVDKNLREDISLKLELKPVPKAAAIGTDLFKLLDLNPIYFDYDKSNIRPDAEIELAKIINYMKEFPTVKVDVRSHTDSRGKDSYNFALSNRRNRSTINYLIEIGKISQDRLTGKGYGETMLVNECSNGVKCSKQAHQDNRRSEFIIVAN